MSQIMNKNPFLLPKILSPIKSMVCAFILGPLVLSLLYYYSLIYKLPGIEERGLFQFYSATIGDFFVLPTTWFLMSKYYQKMQLVNIKIEQSQVAQVLAYFIGLLFAIVVTLAGIYGSNRDWTIPEYGKINVAGIYHSLFMALMLGTFCGFCFNYWKTVFVNKSRNFSAFHALESASMIYWAILNLVTFFFVLLWADNIYSVEKSRVAFFDSNKIQQICWGVFLIVNIWLSVKNNLTPKNRFFVWLVMQVSIVFVLVAFGMILADLGGVL